VNFFARRLALGLWTAVRRSIAKAARIHNIMRLGPHCIDVHAVNPTIPALEIWRVTVTRLEWRLRALFSGG
jgi:hypothetical protein